MAHMHYKGTGKIHSFWGLLKDDDQRKIRIQGPVGAIAWRITKFQVMGNNPTSNTQESVVQVWREEQTGTMPHEVDFRMDELLGVGLWMATDSTSYPATTLITIFDNALFSRNIWITHQDINADPGVGCNYYIELEEVKVSNAGMAQLAVAAARRI